MSHEQLVHRGRRFNEIGRDIRVKDRLRLIARLEMPCMSQLVRQREHIRHLMVPAQQDVGIFPVGACTEAARRLSLILGEIHPSLTIGCPDHIHIIFPENRQSLLYVFLRAFNRDIRRVTRVYRQLQICIGHSVQVVHPTDQSYIFAHMWSQLIHDQVDLAVIELPVDLLSKEQIIKYGVGAAEVRQHLICLDIRIICRSSHVLILSDLLGESGKSRPAHCGIRLVFVIVLKEGIAQRIFLAANCKRLEFHVCQLCGIVDLIGRAVDALTQCRDHALRLRVQLVRFLPQNILQISLVVFADFYRRLYHFLRLLRDLAAHKAQPAVDLRTETAYPSHAFLIMIVIIVHRNRKVAVIPHQCHQLSDGAVLADTFFDPLRRVQLTLIFLRYLLRKLLCLLRVGEHVLLRRINSAEIPCKLLRDVFPVL